MEKAIAFGKYKWFVNVWVHRYCVEPILTCRKILHSRHWNSKVRLSKKNFVRGIDVLVIFGKNRSQ